MSCKIFVVVLIAKFLNMDKIWYCGAKKRVNHMVNTLGDDVAKVGCRVQKKKKRKSLDDDPRSGWPATATTPEIIDYVHQIVKGDRRLTISHMAKKVGISRELMKNFLRKLACPNFLLDGCYNF